MSKAIPAATRGSANGPTTHAADDWFRDLCDQANDLIQSVSPEGVFLYVNRAWKRALGYEDADLEHLNVFDIIHPDHHDHCREVLGEIMDGRPAKDITADFLGKDGRIVSVEGSASLRRRNGTPYATVGIFRDVTERKRAEDQVDRLFALSMDMLCVAGTDGYFKQINPAFERVLGFSHEELLSRSFLEFVHPDDREATIEEVERLKQGLPVVDFKNRYRDRLGRYHWLAWRSTPVPEKGLIYATARDITQQMKIQEELARSNADLEQFAYAASHDLRAPLRAIANLAEWIEEEMQGKGAGKAGEYLQAMRGRVERMEALVDDLLKYARVGRETDSIVEVDPVAVLEDLVELISPPEGFVIHVQGPMPVLKTQRAPFDLVLRNLVGNAVKHHDRPDGRVEVSAKDLGEFCEFTVRDDGPGIPPEYHEKVFQMFQKLESRDEVEGTGMGLALVRRIVEGRGGAVHLESRGRGTTFRFTWPKEVLPEDRRDGHPGR